MEYGFRGEPKPTSVIDRAPWVDLSTRTVSIFPFTDGIRFFCAENVLNGVYYSTIYTKARARYRCRTLNETTCAVYVRVHTTIDNNDAL